MFSSFECVGATQFFFFFLQFCAERRRAPREFGGIFFFFFFFQGQPGATRATASATADNKYQKPAPIADARLPFGGRIRRERKKGVKRKTSAGGA
jgi:hypothetical protein